MSEKLGAPEPANAGRNILLRHSLTFDAQILHAAIPQPAPIERNRNPIASIEILYHKT